MTSTTFRLEKAHEVAHLSDVAWRIEQLLEESERALYAAQKLAGLEHLATWHDEDKTVEQACRRLAEQLETVASLVDYREAREAARYASELADEARRQRDQHLSDSVTADA